jgi:hypothetical protein
MKALPVSLLATKPHVTVQLGEKQRLFDMKSEAESSEAAANIIRTDFSGDWRSQSALKHTKFKRALDLFRSLSDAGSDTARVTRSIEALVLDLANQGGKMYAAGLADCGRNAFHSAILQLERFHELHNLICDELHEAWPVSVIVDLVQSARALQLAVRTFLYMFNAAANVCCSKMQRMERK